MNKKAESKSAARVVREQMAAEKRRKRTIWTVVISVFAVSVLGLFAWMFFLSNQAGAVNTPAAANQEGNGIVTGTGPVVVEDYVDFLCPHCKTFHTEVEPAITRLLAENKITLVQHPVAYLDRASSNRYSTRSSAASGCASDAGKFNEYVSALFASQPAEGSAGPTDEQLIMLGSGVGMGESFAECVRDKRYVTWAKKVSDDATQAGITGTPTVLVNGKKVASTSAAILAAVG